MNSSDRFFSEEQKERIVEATRKAESRTIGEIVVLVAESSGRHHDIEVISGLGLSAVISLPLAASAAHGAFWIWVILTAVLFPVGYLFFARAQAITLRLVADQRIDEAVSNHARQTFQAHGLDKAKRRTGVLFYISLLERRVVVFADQGIFGKITQKTLDQYASDVATGIKDGAACEALIKAITGIGEVLPPVALPGDA